MDNARDSIFEALARGNGKLATQLSAKLCGQFPKASFPRLLDQYVRFRQNKGKYDAKVMLEPLLENSSLPSDLRSLELLHQFRLELGHLDRALDGYKKAMQKYPSLEIGYGWFSKAIEDLNLRHMVQASFQLKRWSQDPRMMQFWNALSTVALIKLQPKQITEKERQLNATLALKTLEGLKPFQSDQETIIFCHVCEICDNKSKEIVVELLPAFEQGSHDKFSVDLYLKNFLINHLSIVGDNHNLFNVCNFLLQYLDDFTILTNLIESGKACNKPKGTVEEIIGIRKSRNHFLARLHLDVVYGGTIMETSIESYLEHFHDKPCCVPDLTHYQKEIPITTIKKSMSKFPGGLVHDCNYTKLVGDNDRTYFFELFSKYKHTLKEKPKTDYSCCSYFILQILHSLINDECLSLENAVTGIALLEEYQALDPYNFETRVWLVVMYNYLGCPTLAYEHFVELKVKNLQVDSVDFLMTTRYSTLFPVKDHGFAGHLRSSDNVHKSTANLPRFIQISFERKSYSKILGMLELYHKVTTSLTKWSRLGEQLQQARIFNDKRGELLRNLQDSLTMLCQYSTNYGIDAGRDLLLLSDNRDFSILGSMQTTCTEVTAYLKQDSASVLATCLQELLLGLSNSGERNEVIEEILLAHGTALSSKMTPAERWAFGTIKLVYESQFDESKTSQLVEQLSACPELGAQAWHLVHDFHLQLATLKTLDQMKRIKDSKCRSLVKSLLRRLREEGPNLIKQYLDTVAVIEPSNGVLQQLNIKPMKLRIANSIMATFKSARNL
ncbi:LADA_0F05688g1_1 [Lachancea dasiensis]|uniref:LADA_0F05688g1_1 n=1 Tax=Lachancea dasiensis TaxID=1072105 RepID=A0A1G4JJR0_9SACH|nr:LADA_0F05688g1_1 [Lachancea dasiensis]